MTTEQQEELLMGLRTEVLELKEILADNYYDKSQLSDIYITDDDLSSKLKSYLTSIEINNKYKTITASDKRDDELEKLINACALSSQLGDYVTKNDFDDYKSSIGEDIKSLEESVTYNSDCIKKSFYTRTEIDKMGFIKELPSLDYLASIDWVESKGYLTAHQSLDAYATINWVKTQLESKNMNLDAYAKISSIPKRTSDLVNDSGYLSEHQSLSGYAKTEDIDGLKSDIYNIKSAFNNYVKNSEYITIKDVESYIGLLNLEGTYAKHSDIDEIVGNLNNYATLTDLSNVKSNYAKKSDIKLYCANTYAKKSDIDECNIKISNVNDIVSNTQSSLTNYMKKSDASAYYVTKSDFEKYTNSFVTKADVSRTIYDEMSSYATVTELEKCKSTISTLSEFKSNTTTRLSNIENRIYDLVDNDYLKGKLDELKSSFISSDELEAYITKTAAASALYDTKLNEYVKKVDIGEFITHSDATKDYIKKNEIDSYIPNLSSYSTKSDLNEIKGNIEELTTDILNNTGKIEIINQKLSNYYTKTDVSTKISKIYSDLTTNLSNYAKKSDLTKVTKSLVTKKEIDEKLSYYITASRLHDYVDSYISENIEQIVKNYINSQLNVYLTKGEAAHTYLAIEDYKYLKSAAVIDDSFKYSYKDFYHSLYDDDCNPLDDVKLHNGFYIVEGTLYFVYNGEFIELEMIEYWKEEK